ncbi:MAG: hypothetical protein ACYCZF_00700 [Anaerolineae bacterium]
MTSYRDFLREAAVSRCDLDVFLDPHTPSMAQFDAELGYILNNNLSRDGIAGSRTIQTVDGQGARQAGVYGHLPCRISTYGDSFTQCAQVSDYETWQCYLAGHLGEPLRNWGVGGFGFYQAYRRMVRTELSSDGAEYVLLYLWGDDHHRSLLRCRHALTQRWWDSKGGRAFHGNFWRHLEMDLSCGKLLDVPNLLPTPESLYRMCDPEFMVEALCSDLMLQMSAYCQGIIDEIDMEAVNRLAEILGQPKPTGDTPAELKQALIHLRDAYAFAASIHILDEAHAFCLQQEKKLLVILFDPQVTRQLITTGRRYDQPVVDHLQKRGYPYFDMNLAQVEDFKCFNLPLEAYMKRYLIGHYNPAGNHLFAYALAPVLVEWLEPKPLPYQDESEGLVSFEGYLPALRKD